jgi:hypothetical protein
VDSIEQTCFPFLLGVLHDRFGSYHFGLLLLIFLALSGTLAIGILPDAADPRLSSVRKNSI